MLLLPVAPAPTTKSLREMLVLIIGLLSSDGADVVDADMSGKMPHRPKRQVGASFFSVDSLLPPFCYDTIIVARSAVWGLQCVKVFRSNTLGWDITRHGSFWSSCACRCSIRVLLRLSARLGYGCSSRDWQLWFMFLSMFVEHYLDVLGNGRWILCLSGCSGSIGTLLTIQSLSLYSSVTLFVFGLILISAGNSILLLSWIDYLSHADPKEPSQAYCRRLALCCRGDFPAPCGAVWRSWPGCVLFSARAVGVDPWVRCSGRAWEANFGARDCLGEGHTWKGSLSRLLIAVLGVSFAFGIVRTFKSAALSMNAGGSWLFLVIAACLIAILTTAWVLSKRTPLIVTFYRCCIPVLILAYLLLPFARGVLFDLDLALLMSACFLFEMLVWLACPLIVVEGDLKRRISVWMGCCGV